MVFDANKREFVTQEEVVGEVVKQLLDDDVNMKEYIKAVGALGIDADKPMVCPTSLCFDSHRMPCLCLCRLKAQPPKPKP